MKAIFKVVLILLIGMISLNGYSSTTTHTTKKMDNIEKQVIATTLGVAAITENLISSVENLDQDIGQSNSLYNYNTIAIANTKPITREVPLNPPPLLG